LADRTGIKYVICNYDSIVPVKSKKGDKKSTRTGLDVQKKSIIKSMIIDESVRVSNPRASITKFLLKHFDHIKYKYLLSGNPAPENESQYCTQMILAHGHFMLYKAFWQFQHYCYNQIGFEKIPKAGVRDQIYDFVHKNAFVLTRSEAGLKNLKEYVKHFIPMTKTQSTAYKAMLVKYQYKQIEAMNELTQLTYLQQLAAGIDISEPDGLFLGENKINHILKLLSKEGDLYGQQVIIWSRFTSENKEIFRRLTEAGYSIELVDGSVIPEARENIRLRFNAHLTQITCATIRSMYSGTDWSGADTAIYTSNEASWDLRSQSEDRIYSVSKSRPLQIIDLCSEKTIDEEIVDLLREKKIDSNFFLSKLYARIKQMKEENA
jgi:SNF2 family DNA or RNA helicase